MKRREKDKEKYTFVTKGYDGPWQGGDVTVTFYFEKKDPHTSQKLPARISLWGGDDFGMERVGSSELDFYHLRHQCSSGSLPSVSLLRWMGYICSRNHADQNKVYENYFKFKKEQEKGYPSCPPGQNSIAQEKEELDNCEQCGDASWDGRICHSCGAKSHKE